VPLGAPLVRVEPAASGSAESIDLVLAFELPAGSFATAVLGELVDGPADLVEPA
jgi:tRNA(Glu) U13 pseudouridine synthase TruD